MLKRRSSDIISNFVIDSPSGFVQVWPPVVEKGPDYKNPGPLTRLPAVWGLAALAAVVMLLIASVGSGSETASANSTLVTPEGVTINVYVNTVTAQQVENWLRQSGLQAHVGLTRVDVVETGYDVSAVGGYCNSSGCGAYPGSIQFNDDSLLAHWAFTAGHEYGHVWENYYRWKYWQGSFDAYLEARGLLGSPLIGSKTCLKPHEMLATDYWRLFGAPETQVSVAKCHKDVPWAEDVPGLREFLALEWTHGNPPPGYSGAGGGPTPAPSRTATPMPTASATATPQATASPAPTATPTQEPTATPTEEAAPPGGEVLVTMDFGNGWHSFTAPITGATNKPVYVTQGKRESATHHVDRGRGYRIKGPVKLEIRGE